MSEPFNALHEALAAAQHKDMPDIQYQTRDWEAWKNLPREEQTKANGNNPKFLMITKTRRPYIYDLDVNMFSQTWGSTALGYGGIGGASMTTAYTVVVTCGNDVCVYFGGGELAYRLNLDNMSPTGRASFYSDLRDHRLEDVRKAAIRYV